MEKGIKEFLKKRGQETLQEAILDWMFAEMPGNDKGIAVEDGLIIAFSKYTDNPNVHHRIPALLIGVSGKALEMLEEETGLLNQNSMYGERVMMRLFDYLLINEHECWIMDTDVLNWDINTGGLRDPYDLFVLVREMAPTLFESTFQEYFGNPDEMPVFIRIELKEYLS